MNDEGISLWRRIGETLLGEVERGVLKPGDKVPSSEVLAARFGVNRHTAMRAVAYLAQSGVVEVHRGRGAYITAAVTYRLGSKTRLEQNLLENRRTPTRQLLGVEVEQASRQIAGELGLKAGDRVARVTLLGEADKVPVSVSENYFSLARLPEVVPTFQRAAAKPGGRLSISKVLADLGVSDYRRKTIHILGRAPTASEIEHLCIPKGEYVLEVEATNVDSRDRPIMYAKTAFSSSRIVFAIEF